MNKLMGFLELKEMNLPAVPWKQYTGEEKLSADYLWTVRSAVYRGNDLNLPRSVGKKADETKAFADNLLKELGDRGMVVYYPYFIANKSGTMEVRNDSVIVEAVRDDLWNLVTENKRDVTIITKKTGEKIFNGDASFLTMEEQEQLYKYVPEIRRIFRDNLLEGNSVLLEWSFAVSCDSSKKPTGPEYLVFYEIRTV